MEEEWAQPVGACVTPYFVLCLLQLEQNFDVLAGSNAPFLPRPPLILHLFLPPAIGHVYLSNILRFIVFKTQTWPAPSEFNDLASAL